MTQGWNRIMVIQTIEAEIRKQLDRLPLEQQHQVLEFARSLVAAHVRGMPGNSLLRFAGTIDGDDLAIMKQAIEDGCERVDQDDW